MIYHTHKGAENDANSLTDLGPCVRDVVKALRPVAGDFDTIAVQGMSGVIVGAPVSLILKKGLTVVRKNGEDCHSTRRRPGGYKVIGVEGIGPGKRVLFLDDFISMGDTRKRVQEAVAAEGGATVAIYQYHYDKYERMMLREV